VSKILRGVKDDVRFVRTHTLQPPWYKVLKVFILLGFLAGYGYAFGLKKLAVFAVFFMVLSLGVHLLYRTKTQGWTRSWLDFEVTEVDGERRPTRIGGWYYTFVGFNALVSVLVSQLLA